MKKITFALTVLPLIMVLVTGGCTDMIMGRPETGQGVPHMPEGTGLLTVSLAGVNVGAGRTLLSEDPRFTRYELAFFTDGSGNTPSSTQASYSLPAVPSSCPLRTTPRITRIGMKLV